jgi:ATP-dependent Lon protease
MNQIELFQGQLNDEPVVVHEIDLFDPQVVSEARFISGDRDAIDRDKRIAAQLMEFGHRRRLVTPTTALVDSIRALGCSFPNMQEVAEYLADEALLAMACNQPYRPMPCLLHGQPGIGKTEFTSAFADAIGVGAPLEINFETAQTVSQLAGSERHWANAAPGRLFTCLATAPVASPVVLLEEIDKASGHYGDPLSPLLGLLEERTAMRWHDLCADWLTLDASNVIWVSNANDPDRVSPPVLSRFQVFEIEPLDDAAVALIGQRIYEKLTGSIDGFGPLSEPVIDALVSYTRSPRDMKKSLKRALALAVKANRRHLVPDDVAQKKYRPVTRTRRIGFI